MKNTKPPAVSYCYLCGEPSVRGILIEDQEHPLDIYFVCRLCQKFYYDDADQILDAIEARAFELSDE